MREVIACGLVAVLMGCGGAGTATGVANSKAPPKGPAPKPSKDWLIGLAAGHTPLDTAIDPSRGLMLVDMYQGAEGAPNPRGKVHICAAQMTAFRDTWQSEIAKKLQGQPDTITCDASTCRVGGEGEWDPVYHFYTADHEGTLVIVGIGILDEVAVPPQHLDPELEEVAKTVSGAPHC